MTGEEVVGPAGPKLVRLLYFVGTGCNDLLLPYASTIDQFSYARRRSISTEIFNGSPFNYRRSRPMRYRKQSNDNQSPRVLGFHQSSVPTRDNNPDRKAITINGEEVGGCLTEG
ncbi:hypothetical protein RHGRI_018318 [Rhododendron griersonianum]|uniref:Uncharacterized protein n=1 Tax=Rhododendron griersonianum TaxID=479676 RepID=A0AAV6K119_9ERIC|nr:hypothetical protein RHGRI_018318 [Rhododendron griersonianum]